MKAMPVQHIEMLNFAVTSICW